MRERNADHFERQPWTEMAANALRALASVVILGVLIVLAFMLAAVIVSDRG